MPDVFGSMSSGDNHDNSSEPVAGFSTILNWVSVFARNYDTIVAIVWRTAEAKRNLPLTQYVDCMDDV